MSRTKNLASRSQPTNGSSADPSNLATADIKVFGTNLLASILKILEANKDTPLPIQLIEIADVVFIDGSKEVGATDERRLVAVACSEESGFDTTHKVLKGVLDIIGVPFAGGKTNLCIG